jgi:hypothetical protein
MQDQDLDWRGEELGVRERLRRGALGPARAVFILTDM